jgi:hypothetical protein
MTFAQPLPLPQPISIPLDAFLSGAGARGESDLAYFLIRHILASWAKIRGQCGSNKGVEAGWNEAGAGYDCEGGGSERDDRYGRRDAPETRTFGGGNGIASAHRYEPDRTKDAEELAWIEIYKAKTFVNRLGAKWAQGRVGEKEMRGMAKALGLALKERERERRGVDV